MASIASELRLNGLATGIDSAKIIEGLTSINQQRIDQLNNRKASIVQQQVTFGGLQAKLLDLQGRVSSLSRSVSGAFEGRKATVSDDTIAVAAASSTAQAGTFSIRVDALAQAAQVSSEGFSDSSTNIREGTLTLKVGAGTATTVTIDSTNNTLQGLVSAINNSGGEVKASIVRDGSATPFRVLLTSSKTGAANTIQVTNNLTSGSGASINLNQTVQSAADAQIRLGTGAGAITATSATNTVSDLITGVTLNLKQADPSKTLSLTVENDTEAAQTAVKDLVNSFNSVIAFIDERDNFDPQTQTAGVLLGNREVSELQNELRNVLSESVGGVNAKANNLASVGISFTSTGRLQVNESKLADALNGEIEGVSLADVRRLFALTGDSTNTGVEFITGSEKTLPTGPTPVKVNVSLAAKRASITGAVALAGMVTITSANNTFAVRLNGITSKVISLQPGNYSAADLAAAIQASINADAQLLNNDVSVDLDAGRLRIQSQAFGSAANLSFISGGTALGLTGPLGFEGIESSTGTNVVGSFDVGGRIESATGIGQILSGNSGNATTDGLQLKVTLGDSQLSGTPDAEVRITQGVASRLNAVLSRFVDPAEGRLKSIDDRFVRNIEDIDKSVTRQNTQLDERKEQLVRQFAAMESAVSRLRNMGDQLTAQLGRRN